MKNFSKILIILIVFMLSLVPTIFSLGIDMDLQPNTVENQSSQENITAENDSQVSNTNTSNATSSNNPKSVTVVSADENDFFTIENILSIIIIVIGIILVLLGIAILIRFK